MSFQSSDFRGPGTALLVAVALALAPGEATAATAQDAACDAGAVKVGNPYKGVFFENDFSYLDNPCLADNDPRGNMARFTDGWKRQRMFGGGYLDVGGEFRLRLHSEDRLGKTRLDGIDNSFALTRIRLYANAVINGHLRVYAEMIDARITGHEFGPRGIDVDHTDFLNAFIELKGDLGGGRSLVSERSG